MAGAQGANAAAYPEGTAPAPGSVRPLESRKAAEVGDDGRGESTDDRHGCGGSDPRGLVVAGLECAPWASLFIGLMGPTCSSVATTGRQGGFRCGRGDGRRGSNRHGREGGSACRPHARPGGVHGESPRSAPARTGRLPVGDDVAERHVVRRDSGWGDARRGRVVVRLPCLRRARQPGFGERRMEFQSDETGQEPVAGHS